MIARREDGCLLISDSGVYEPPITCPRILRRLAKAKFVFFVFALLALATGALISLNY